MGGFKLVVGMIAAVLFMVAVATIGPEIPLLILALMLVIAGFRR